MSGDRKPQLPTRSELAARLDVKLEGWETVSPSQRAYLAALIETAGNQGRAAEAAGVHRSTPWKWENGFTVDGTDYPPNPAYLRALKLAKDVAANMLEDEARRRAFEGVRRYVTYQGKPVLHPDLCDCGHHRRRHAPRGAQTETGEDMLRPCHQCPCEDFQGAPLVEHHYSDKLLQILLGAHKPDEYGTQRVQMLDGLRNLDLQALPDHVIARLATGEHPYAVLASALDELEGLLLAPGVELGGPGTSPAQGVRAESGSDLSRPEADGREEWLDL